MELIEFENIFEKEADKIHLRYYNLLYRTQKGWLKTGNNSSKRRYGEHIPFRVKLSIRKTHHMFIFDIDAVKECDKIQCLNLINHELAHCLYWNKRLFPKIEYHGKEWQDEYDKQIKNRGEVYTKV